MCYFYDAPEHMDITQLSTAYIYIYWDNRSR